MIQEKNIDLKYLHDFRRGEIPMGLGIDAPMDNNMRFKRGELCIFCGHDNVGKTYWFTWYALVLALKHDIKFCMYTGENSSGNVMRDLIQMYIGKPFKEIPSQDMEDAYNLLQDKFEFVDNSILYKPKDLFKIFKETDADACLIDPFTGLDRKMTFEGNYEFLNEARQFCNSTKKNLYISSHPNSESGRSGNLYPEKHDWAGHLKAPLKAHIEGGKSFLNRADLVFMVHRLVAHEDMKTVTMVSVEKVKDTATGGACTMLDEPMMFEFNYGMGFKQGFVDPLEKLRYKNKQTKELNDFLF